MKTENSFQDLQEYLDRKLKNKDYNVKLFMDIETAKHNIKASKPTHIKAYTISVAFTYGDTEEELSIYTMANFYDFFELMAKLTNKAKYNKLKFELWFHNGRNFDNHFFLFDGLTKVYPDIERHQMDFQNVEEELSNGAKKGVLNKKSKRWTLEARVKTSTSLELEGRVDNFNFKLKDSYPITMSTIAKLGKTLNRRGALDEKYLKTDFEYDKYDKREELTTKEERANSEKIFNNYSADEKTYIANDVILLWNIINKFDVIYPGFDIEAMTLSVNVLNDYIKNPVKGTLNKYNTIARFQLLNKINWGMNFKDPKKQDDYIRAQKKDKDIINIDYSKYELINDPQQRTLQQYFKTFYSGGLCLYNPFLVNSVITGKILHIDINSSYPTSMYKHMIPTFYSGTETEEQEYTFTVKDETIYRQYEVNYETFNKMLKLLNSDILSAAFTKRSNSTGDGYTTVESFMLEYMLKRSGLDELKFQARNVTTWLCIKSGLRDRINELYAFKSKGKSMTKLEWNSSTDIVITDMTNDERYSEGEVAMAKLKLNAIYGIPALRPYFDYIELKEDGSLQMHHNSFKNSSRNVVFASFVTSASFYNLLSPLLHAPGEAIDKYFVYCDTDSLFFKEELWQYMEHVEIHPYNLGAWDMEHKNITKMMVMNHKKYAIEYIDDDGVRKLDLHAGGVTMGSFKLKHNNGSYLQFEELIKAQFHAGKRLTVTRSVMNEDGLIVIYDGVMDLQAGGSYPVMKSLADDKRLQAQKESYARFMEEHQSDADVNEENPDALYVETPYGSFSPNDVYATPEEEEPIYTNKTLALTYRKIYAILREVI